MSNERKAVYTVRPRGEGKKDFWCRIGTCWTNRDGSFTVTLDALPIDGRLVIRVEEERRDDRDAPPRGGRAAPRPLDQDPDDLPF